MMLKSLADEREIEFIVSDTGNAMLLHKGALNHQYSWAEYDCAGASLNFITPDGKIQPLGFKIHELFQGPLSSTLEMLLIQVGDDMTCKDIRFIKFVRMISST